MEILTNAYVKKPVRKAEYFSKGDFIKFDYFNIYHGVVEGINATKNTLNILKLNEGIPVKLELSPGNIDMNTICNLSLDRDKPVKYFGSVVDKMMKEANLHNDLIHAIWARRAFHALKAKENMQVFGDKVQYDTEVILNAIDHKLWPKTGTFTVLMYNQPDKNINVVSETTFAVSTNKDISEGTLESMLTDVYVRNPQNTLPGALKEKVRHGSIKFFKIYAAPEESLKYIKNAVPLNELVDI